ncbi:MAG: hypothetical protein OXT09_16520 [Myxococcales bacterium]|nr:hypothetical protein [Myxococcales bacterium]
MRHAPIALAALALLLTTTRPADATVVRHLELEELVLHADAIVHGTVRRAGSQGAAPGNRLPHTVAQVAVHEWIAGDGPTSTLLVREPGAIAGDRRIALHGAPRYREGDEVVLFLVRDRGGHYRTLGMAQGCFFVEPQLQGPARVVRRLDELAFARTQIDGLQRIESARAELPAALPSLLALVRALAEYRP